MIEIAEATAAHHGRVLDIYNHYVLEDHATFDTEALSMRERSEWFSQFATTGPHRLLVASVGGFVTGYASSTPFRAKPAYRGTVETTVYVDPEHRGAGIGRTLMTAMLELLDAAGTHLAVAAIALPNDASEGLHRGVGFRPVGVMHQVGRKFDRWIDVRWYERARPD